MDFALSASEDIRNVRLHIALSFVRRQQTLASFFAAKPSLAARTTLPIVSAFGRAHFIAISIRALERHAGGSLSFFFFRFLQQGDSIE